jgi:hypothetical protein
VKALQKKLKQIAAIRLKSEGGAELTWEQTEKLKDEANIRKELASFEKEAQEKGGEPDGPEDDVDSDFARALRLQRSTEEAKVKEVEGEVATTPTTAAETSSAQPAEIETKTAEEAPAKKKTTTKKNKKKKSSSGSDDGDQVEGATKKKRKAPAPAVEAPSSASDTANEAPKKKKKKKKKVPQ